jgi:hypothetical protein
LSHGNVRGHADAPWSSVFDDVVLQDLTARHSFVLAGGEAYENRMQLSVATG